ncbi:hypothetical protein AVEN_172105-1 [Araneus ventricosus]|uniref:Uncharacterized protein n=1 Tax=Araneus ventricosus TaxID=182803 RepID=A0A4Y2E2Y8_ARAVE|nr:hypothetical protein AVEN_172105-1 [Araneus ventricosus]
MEVSFLSVAIKGLSPLSLGISLAALLLAIAYLVLRDKDLPPGPIGLPYFGYWAFMNNANGHLKLDVLKKTYGDITSFTYTGRLFINLGSIKAIREAVINKADCFGDRMSGYSLMTHLFGDGKSCFYLAMFIIR